VFGPDGLGYKRASAISADDDWRALDDGAAIIRAHSACGRNRGDRGHPRPGFSERAECGYSYFLLQISPAAYQIVSGIGALASFD
jgi:hypothetical protein